MTVLSCPISLDYAYSAGQSASRFLRAIAEGKLLGQRCPVDGRVYFPEPRRVSDARRHLR